MESPVFEMAMSFIGSVGFPIVCCILLWKYISETMKEFTKTMDENTRMLNRICDRLDMWKEKDEHE